MPIDRRYIFNKVNFLLKQENKFFTSSEIHMLIGVDSFRRIAEDINYPKTNFSSYVASGVWSVSSPSDFIKVDATSEVTFQDSSDTYKLDPEIKTNIGRANILTATPGTPSNYFMESESKIGIYPPSTSGCIVVPYVSHPTSLSSDTDTNELTEQAYMAAAYWTVHECFLKDNDEKRAGKYEIKYLGEIKRLNKRFGDLYEVPHDIQPDEDYTQR